MNTLEAFARGQAARGQIQRVFDWVKAAQILKESGAKNAIAGLSSDMEWTSDDILVNGKIPDKGDCFLSSNWATPVLIIDDSYDEIECWKYEDECNYDSDTFWPEDARRIFTQ